MTPNLAPADRSRPSAAASARRTEGPTVRVPDRPYVDAYVRSVLSLVVVGLLYAEFVRRFAGEGFARYVAMFPLYHTDYIRASINERFGLVDVWASPGTMHLEAVWNLFTWWPVTAFLLGGAVVSAVLEYRSRH